jgi:hypothetical protein
MFALMVIVTTTILPGESNHEWIISFIYIASDIWYVEM